MKIPYSIIKKSAFLYISIPIVIFLLGWVKLSISIPIVLLLCFSLYKINKKDSKEKMEKSNIPFSFLLIGIGIGLLWCYLAGQGGLFYQSGDHAWRNAVFRDLINYEWPVVYPDYDRALVYYIGHWLVPSFVGKVGLWITGSTQIAWVVGNISLLIWSTIGIAIVFALFLDFVKADTKKKVFFSIAVMIFFSGLDIIGGILFHSCDMNHLEWWGKSYQFSSLTTCLFWVFNQTIIPWIITFLVLKEKTVENYAFLASICLLSGPLPTIGIVIYLAGMGIIQLIQSMKQKKGKEFFKQVGSIQNITAFFCILPIVGLYLTSNSAIGTGVLVSLERGQEITRFIGGLKYLVFILLEMGIYAIFLFQENKKNPIYYLTVVSLCFIPMIYVGTGSDFSMRASIPGILILMSLTVQFLLNHYKTQKKKCVILIAILLIGAFTPIIEYKRAVSTIIEEKKINATVDTIGTFNQETVPLLENFITENYEEKLFYRYFTKK